MTAERKQGRREQVSNTIAEMNISHVRGESFNRYTVRFFGGSDIEDATADLWTLAATLNRRITADFNGVELVADFPAVVAATVVQWRGVTDGSEEGGGR